MVACSYFNKSFFSVFLIFKRQKAIDREWSTLLFEARSVHGLLSTEKTFCMHQNATVVLVIAKSSSKALQRQFLSHKC